MTNEAPSRTNLEFVPPDQPENATNFLTLAWRRKWIVVMMLVVGLGLGYLYFLKETPIYKSTAQVLLVHHKKENLPFTGVEMSSGYDNTHEHLLRSPLVVGEAVKRSEALRSLPTLAGNPDPVGTIIGGLTVTTASRDQRSGDVYNLSYTSPGSQDCPVVLRAVIEAYEAFLDETYQQVGKNAATLIEEAKDTLINEIEIKQREYDNWRKTQSALLYAGQSLVNTQEGFLKQVQDAKSAAMIENSQLEAKINAIEGAIRRGANREALNLMVGQLQNEREGQLGLLTEMQRNAEDQLIPTMLEEQLLLERYGEDHPKVQAVRKRLEFMRQKASERKQSFEDGQTQPKDFFEVYLESLRERIVMNEQTIKEMADLSDAETKRAEELATSQLKDEAYRAEIKRRQDLFEVTVTRLGELTLLKDTNAITVQRLSEPAMGVQIRPDLVISLVVAGILGSLAGLGLAYIVERTDRRFRSPDEIRSDLGLPVVGHIPVIAGSTASRTESRKKGDDAEDSHALSPVLSAHHNPRGRTAEAYRAVRTALYFSNRGGGHQVIQVTSASPGDGKTTLACNLAVTIANSGKKTLIVDCDFRRPRCHHVFGSDDTAGVTGVLDGTAELSDVVQETGVENLYILACGRRPPNPSELLTSGRFEELLAVLREKFEFVVVDTPPVLAVTDPLNVAPRVDGVLLVMRLTSGARASSRRALSALEEMGANMLGVVVNGVGSGPGYGGYGKYGYGNYGYGYSYSGYRGYGGYGYGGYGYGSYGYRDGDGVYGANYGESSDRHYYEDADAASEPHDTSSNGKVRVRPSPNGQS